MLAIALAAGLHLGVQPARRGAAGPAVLALGAVGPVPAGGTGPNPPHFLLLFGGAVLGFALLSRRISRDPRWRGLTGYVLATAVALAVVARCTPRSRCPLHPWWGLLD